MTQTGKEPSVNPALPAAAAPAIGGTVKKPKQKRSTPLRDYLDEIVDTLRDLVPAAIEGDEDAVHDARVATRRLKAATDLLDDLLPEKQVKIFRRALRDLRRALGPLRDADVMLDHTGDLQKGSKLPPAALRWLHTCLQDNRRKALANLTGDIDRSRLFAKLGRWWELRHHLLRSADRIDNLLAKSLHLLLSQFTQQVHGLFSPGEGKSDVDPHALRITGKLLRYTLEMAAADGHALSPTVGRSFKRVQSALGLWHDLIVLAERAMEQSVVTQLPLHDTVLQQDVLRLVSVLLRRADAQLRSVGKLWERQGAQLTRAIESSFPKEIQNLIVENPIVEPAQATDAAPEAATQGTLAQESNQTP